MRMEKGDRRRFRAILWLFLSFTISVCAQNAYEKRVFVSLEGDSLPYRFLRPDSEKSGEKYPLVLFLHGGGERGEDNEKQLTHGAQMFLNPVNREKYPAFVLFPQCPSEGYWAYATRPSSFTPAGMPVGQSESPLFRSLKQLLDSCMKMPNIDSHRIYIIGLSMGAMGTYDLVVRYPQLFAAAIPICGTVNSIRLQNVKEVSFRIFHGDADPIVPVDGSREAYKALKEMGGSVEYIEFPGCGHDSWTPAFNYPGFMDWLFKQRKNP